MVGKGLTHYYTAICVTAVLLCRAVHRGSCAGGQVEPGGEEKVRELCYLVSQAGSHPQYGFSVAVSSLASYNPSLFIFPISSKSWVVHSAFGMLGEHCCYVLQVRMCVPSLATCTYVRAFTLALALAHVV